ncbi:DUF2306 domain-containing protein [Paenibacillus thiaminolyticus]|uniref:DUF2306 domain-containing protein n=1 Tax=Paenibacillus thiaminolyticus TaxID=49283 RepID=A0AAP9DVQ6_PANTH|nr:DUF2306 domain-containing protein [Paenibacillus thiaminolyticus]MCY9535426.1 DUF2306 domain-containing protein [Paenibacillus thiaminolyticus]MCY9604848.1 DUF2306 domain-containing protein [Paenibacillus thiaminolyticus]MCY9610035.1 DUF2306 domain-containing protein [Paenibacillus thiaminolyticus]MCY9615126.1 DUF2306 domain-containing protein [Paenibacillus thiaminolyticus]MCY9621119.1 DUF2306 domain-containing protein [Paenibacillus thiaminolyticus]
MTKRKFYTWSLLAVLAGYIMYVLYNNYLHDPQAAAFLSRKSNAARPINTQVWLPVMKVHAAFACLAILAGAVNFIHTLLRKYRLFHRINGYLYVISVFAVVLTSGYMAPYATGGKPASIAFNLLNMIWMFITVVAIVNIKKKRMIRHRAWMIRSYVFCFTNLTIHLLTFALHEGMGLPYPASYTAAVYATILLLFGLAEIIIRRIGRSPIDFNRSEAA